MHRNAHTLPNLRSADELGARYERGEITDAAFEAATEQIWARELRLPKRKRS
jgi:hypothetical protein